MPPKNESPTRAMMRLHSGYLLERALYALPYPNLRHTVRKAAMYIKDPALFDLQAMSEDEGGLPSGRVLDPLPPEADPSSEVGGLGPSVAAGEQLLQALRREA